MRQIRAVDIHGVSVGACHGCCGYIAASGCGGLKVIAADSEVDGLMQAQAVCMVSSLWVCSRLGVGWVLL